MSKVSHTGGNSLFAKADPKARGKVGYKKKSERKFGDFRLDYLRACKHDFDVKPEHCPFCIMVNVSVKKILQEEEAVAKQRRVTSIINRAKLRYGLLDYWSRSQQSGFSDVILGYVAEITLSGRAVTALDNGFGGNEMPIPDRSDVLKILKRRKRVVAIGKYAATLIQAKLRQHFACIRVRRMLLARFEYVQPRNKKDNTPYFYDKQKQVMWQRLPLLVAADRPASPSTMARRLGGEERKVIQFIHYVLTPPHNIRHIIFDMFDSGRSDSTEAASSYKRHPTRTSGSTRTRSCLARSSWPSREMCCSQPSRTCGSGEPSRRR